MPGPTFEPPDSNVGPGMGAAGLIGTPSGPIRTPAESFILSAFAGAEAGAEAGAAFSDILK